MSITDCDKMNEIIEGSGDDENEVKIEISFHQLNSLELRYLPKLESFCSSGNYSFAFPSLEEVKVRDCPKMKMFSQGDSNTSMLQCVRFCKKGKDHRSWEGVRYYWRWEGNLNSTIQQLFKERKIELEEVGVYGYADEDEIFDENEEDEYSEEHQDNPSTPNTKNPMVEEDENSDEDEEDEYSEEHQDNPSTSNTKNTVVEEDENFEVDEDQDENSDEDGVDEDSEEHQGNPSTSNTENPIEEVHNFVEDQGNPSTSNTQ